jgi:hypothetical protein
MAATPMLCMTSAGSSVHHSGKTVFGARSSNQGFSPNPTRPRAFSQMSMQVAIQIQVVP